MEIACEFNDKAYFTGGGLFSVFSAVVHRCGMASVPEVNVADRMRGGKGDRAAASAARQQVKKAAFLGGIYTSALRGLLTQDLKV